MSRFEEQKVRNEVARFVRVSNRKINQIRLSDGESMAHKLRKIDICRDLVLVGKHFITEAIFVKGGRADVLVLDDAKIIEIVASEKEESLVIKRDKYPKQLEMEVVRI